MRIDRSPDSLDRSVPVFFVYLVYLRDYERFLLGTRENINLEEFLSRLGAFLARISRRATFRTFLANNNSFTYTFCS